MELHNLMLNNMALEDYPIQLCIRSTTTTTKISECSPANVCQANFHFINSEKAITAYLLSMCWKDTCYIFFTLEEQWPYLMLCWEERRQIRFTVCRGGLIVTSIWMPQKQWNASVHLTFKNMNACIAKKKLSVIKL